MKLAHVRNPVMPSLDTRMFEIDGAASVIDALDEAGWHIQPSTFLLKRDVRGDLDWKSARPADVFIKRSQWELEIFEAHETAVLVTLPQGGGGGGGGSNILAVVAQLALLVAAFAIAGPLGAGAWLAGEIGVTTAIATSLVFGAVMIAGQLLLSAILPQPKSPAQPKPTFTIGVQSNTARLGQAIPERFGMTNFAPDLRSQAYLDYTNNLENIYELFCLGVGSFAVQQLRIGTNVIAQADDSGVLQSTGAYPEITWQLCGPNEPVTLFDDNVVTSTEVSSIEMVAPNQLSEEGLSTGWTAWFVANPPNTETTLIAIDLSLPNGLYWEDSSGNIKSLPIRATFVAQPINDVGEWIGDQITLDINRTYATNQPQFFTIEWNVPCGRYTVKGMRTTTVANNTGQPECSLIWAQLRAFLPSQQYYGNSTMLAIQSTASYDLSQESADQINVVATRVLPTPVQGDGALVWSSPQATRSIAAAANYLLSSVNNANLQTTQYDGDWLLFYDAYVWGPRGDTLDGAFDSQQGFWDMLNQALNVGRTQALAGPFIGFVRDEAQSTYRCAFSPRSMIKDSFNINYLFFDPNKDADAVTLNYIDENNWTPYQLFVALPDATDTIDTAPQVNVTTMVNRAQIWREWNYKLAASAYRRIFPTFSTELDGRVCFRGDRVRLSHVMASWGGAADVVSLAPNGFTYVLTLSEPWLQGQSGQPMIEVMTPDGYHCGPVSVNILNAGASSDPESPNRAIVELTQDIVATEGKFAGLDITHWGIWGLNPTDQRRDLLRERPKVLMGQGAEVPVDALVVSMTPRANLQAELQCVVDNPLVYTADQAPVPPYPEVGCTGALANLTITGLTVLQSSGESIFGNYVSLAVTAIGAPDAGTFNYQFSSNGQAWVGPVTGLGRGFTINVVAGPIRLQVQGVADDGELGQWYELDFNATGYGISGESLNFGELINSQYLPLAGRA